MAALRFDFGVTGSPVQTDFLAVVPQTIYSATRGYGWVSRVVGVDRKHPGMSALRRDVNYAKDATFKVDLPDGTSSVRIYHSNPKYNGTVSYVADQIQVIAESLQGGQVIQPTIASIAAGRTAIQTLTVVMHEIGRLLGYEHSADGLMAPVLAASSFLLLPPFPRLPHGRCRVSDYLNPGRESVILSPRNG